MKLLTIYRRLAMFIRISFEVIYASTDRIMLIYCTFGVYTTRPRTRVYTSIS